MSLSKRVIVVLQKHVLPIVFFSGVLVGALAVSALPLIQEYYPVPQKVYPELEKLSTVTWSFKGYDTYFKDLAERKGGVYAFEVLTRANFPDGIDNHLLGHTVGNTLYKQKGIEAIKLCTPAVQNACSHTVVIGALIEFGEGMLGKMGEICKQAPGGKGAYGQCFHGLGHGVLAYTGYTLEKAVPMCKQLGTAEYNNREYIECVGGATMEMVSGVHNPEVWAKQKVKYLKTDDPLSPCNAAFMPEKVKPICYTYLTPYLASYAGAPIFKLNLGVIEKAFSYCSALPEGSVTRSACYGGFGKEFAAIVNGKNVRDLGLTSISAMERVRDMCALAHDVPGEQACDLMALTSFFWGGEYSPDASMRFCTIVPEQSRHACYRDLAGKIHQYSSKKLRAELCSQLPETYQATCRQ
jgi:hypothetical protein